MPFPKNNYPQDVGTDIVAFCNLLERFGEPIDPPSLAYYLEQQNVPKPYDWTAVKAYDGDIAIDGMDMGGVPTTVDAIVIDIHGGSHLVDHLENTTVYIIDSYTGEVCISNPVTLWAVYSKPQVIDVAPTPVKKIYVDQTVDGIRYQKLPGEAPRKMYIKRVEGSQLIDFNTTVTTPREFLSIPHSLKRYGEDVRIMGTASYPIKGYPDEVFYVTLDDWGLFTSTGHVERLQGYPRNDLSELQPPEITRPKELVPITGTAKPLVSLSDIKPVSVVRTGLLESFKRYPESIEHVSEDNSTVMFYDLTGKGKPIALNMDSSATIIGELPHPKTGEIWLREGTTEKTGRWYAAPQKLLIPESEADALQTPTVAERLQRTTDPVTGKKTSGGRFTDNERRYVIPLAKLLAHYNHFSNKIKRK